MKYALVLLPLLFASCSSAPKSTAPTAAKPAPAVSAPAAETPKVVTPPNVISHCKQGTDERTLSVAVKGTGCELNYTKFSKTTAAATSETGTKHCEDVLAKIQKHLESSGFACK